METWHGGRRNRCWNCLESDEGKNRRMIRAIRHKRPETLRDTHTHTQQREPSPRGKLVSRDDKNLPWTKWAPKKDKWHTHTVKDLPFVPHGPSSSIRLLWKRESASFPWLNPGPRSSSCVFFPSRRRRPKPPWTPHIKLAPRIHLPSDLIYNELD